MRCAYRTSAPPVSSTPMPHPVQKGTHLPSITGESADMKWLPPMHTREIVASILPVMRTDPLIALVGLSKPKLRSHQVPISPRRGISYANEEDSYSLRSHGRRAGLRGSGHHCHRPEPCTRTCGSGCQYGI